MLCRCTIPETEDYCCNFIFYIHIESTFVYIMSKISVHLKQLKIQGPTYFVCPLYVGIAKVIRNNSAIFVEFNWGKMGLFIVILLFYSYLRNLFFILLDFRYFYLSNTSKFKKCLNHSINIPVLLSYVSCTFGNYSLFWHPILS